MSRLRPSDLGITHAAAVSGDRAREYERTHDVFGQPLAADPEPPARPKTIRILTPDGAPWTPPAPDRTAAASTPAARGGRPQPSQTPPAPSRAPAASPTTTPGRRGLVALDARSGRTMRARDFEELDLEDLRIIERIVRSNHQRRQS